MEEKEYEIMAQMEDKHWWFVGRRKVIGAMLSRLSLPDNAQILEVGCGSGGNLKMLADYGEVYAVEPNDEARKMAVEKGFARAIEKVKLPVEVPFSEKKFDLIVLLDALEHIEKDVETLKALQSILKESGILFITVPAFKFLWSAHDIVCHHKRRYTKSSISEVLRLAGYKRHYISYFNYWLFPAILAFRLVQKVFGRSKKSDLKMSGKIVNGVFEKVFASERFFIGRLSFPFGVSLMLEATKNQLITGVENG